MVISTHIPTRSTAFPHDPNRHSSAVRLLRAMHRTPIMLSFQLK